MEHVEEEQIEDFQELSPSQPNSLNERCDVPQTALALTEIDEWEIHPIHVHLGHKIGEGYWGQVHRSLLKSVAIRKLRNIISDFRKYDHVFAAVKILKGISIYSFLLMLLCQIELIYVAIIYLF